MTRRTRPKSTSNPLRSVTVTSSASQLDCGGMHIGVLHDQTSETLAAPEKAD